MLGLHAVEHQHSVQVVELVLEQTGLEFVGLDGHLVAVHVDALHEDRLGSGHLDVQAGDAEAPFVVHPLAVGFHDDRVQNHHRLVVHVPHEDLALNAHLRGRQTDARITVVEGVEHLVDDSDDLCVDVGHRQGLRGEHGISECPNLVRHA